MKYTDFTVTDFVADPYFQQWVLTPDEMVDAFWNNWLKEHPHKQPEVDKALQVIRGITFKTDYPGEQEFHQVWQDIITHRATGHYKVKRSVNDTYRWYAAASLLLLGITLTFLWLSNPLYNPFMVAYQTEYGEKQEIMLPDSSLVILGANSQLYYRRGWSTDQPRSVTLQGEANFTVTHQANDQTFIVHSAEVAIEVLGTKFNVNNRRGENQILLEEGSIRLDLSQVEEVPLGENSMMMKPGESVEISAQHIVKKVVNPTPYVSWTKDMLIFDQASLREVIRVLEDQYGYTVTTRGVPVDELVFTAELHTREADMILRYLSEVFNLTINKNKDEITMTPRP